ncbi:MAG: DoxX family protein [Gemmatimonadota bacterium]|nr:DoxX family protein [Gemmatimonadota bacterium]
MTNGGATGRDAARRYGYPAARVMLAAIFVVTGWDKLANPRDAVADIAEVGLPTPFLLAIVAGVVEVACGVLLAVGWRAAWAAVGLLLFLLPVTVLLENPLASPGDFGALIDFLKNLAIMGGLLMVVLWARENHGRESRRPE